jgi:hypothetical protein
MWLISQPELSNFRNAPAGDRLRKEGVRDAAPGQANVARLRDQAAMVNESHALDAPHSTPLRAKGRRSQTNKTRNRPFSAHSQ